MKPLITISLLIINLSILVLSGSIAAGHLADEEWVLYFAYSVGSRNPFPEQLEQGYRASKQRACHFDLTDGRPWDDKKGLHKVILRWGILQLIFLILLIFSCKPLFLNNNLIST